MGLSLLRSGGKTINISNLILFHNLVKSFHLNVDIEEAAFGNFKHEAHLCAGVDPLVEALLGMGVYANEVAGRSSRQDGH